MAEVSPIAGGSGAPGRVVISLPKVHAYGTPYLVGTPEAVPSAIPTRWLDHILAAIDTKFIPGWQALLVDEETYLDRLANPAADGYTDFLAPGVPTRRGRTSTLSTHLHDRRIKGSYDKMVAAIDYLTTTGRTSFEARLTAAKDVYRKEETLPLALTGTYFNLLLGAAVRQWFFLNADPRFQRYRWDIDELSRSFPPDPPFLTAGPKWDVARAHNNLLMQGGCHTLLQIPLGTIHAKLDQLLTDNLRPAYLPPPQSKIRFELVGGVLGIRTMLMINPTP